jgi:hypothetical protein
MYWARTRTGLTLLLSPAAPCDSGPLSLVHRGRSPFLLVEKPFFALAHIWTRPTVIIKLERFGAPS